jgi:hypothetical protein
MTALMPKFRTAHLILMGFVVACLSGRAQTAPPPSPPVPSETRLSAPQAVPPDDRASTTTPADKPLPDIPTLMHEVEANQRKSEKVEKDYIYHSVETAQELDSHGQVKKTTIIESDHFWINGVPVRRVVKKNGKPLTPDEITKENERIDKLTAKANEKREKADNRGKETDPRGNEEVTVSRLLELGAFSNPRRVQLNGRDTIAVDYAGDPKAKTRNRAEEVIRDLSGTAWVDEQDRVLARAEGRFANAFKLGGGLIASVQKDTRFSMQQSKINDEVWLPARFDGQGAVHALLFFGFNGRGQVVNSDYRKFRTTSTILPGATRVDPPQPPEGAAQP